VSLPEINQIVLLRVEDVESPLHTRVEDVDAKGRLNVAHPADDEAAVVSFTTGRELIVEWINPRGLWRLETRIAGRDNIGVPVLVLAQGEPVLFQRREYVRAEAVLETYVEPKREGAREVLGRTVDVSGGGFRAIADVQLEPDEPVFFSLQLPDEPRIDGHAELVRRLDEETLAFRFSEIDEADRERIIKFVFAEQRKQMLTRVR
jgi:c-di-GMP-binding flagellar brake protein YcgR